MVEAENLREPTQAELELFLKERGLNFKKMSSQQQKDALGNFKIYKRMLARKATSEQRLENLKIQWLIPMSFLDAPVSVENGNLPPFTQKSGGKDVVVFANYNCPNCPAAFQKIRFLEANFKDQINLYFRFGLREPEGSMAYQSALASFCAAEQNKFFQLFHGIFSASSLTEPADLRRAIESAQINFDLARLLLKFVAKDPFQSHNFNNNKG
jgi:hypothetical protein